MPELKIDQLSPKSQKSIFSPMIVAEAKAIFKKRPEESIAAIEAHARDRVASSVYSDRLRKESEIDSLTGLLSRRTILREIEREVEEANRQNKTIQVGFTDVRDFKKINDVYSHRAGDYALKVIALGTKSNARGYDSVGRFGGDENVILLPDGDPHIASFLRTRLHQYLEKENSPYNGLIVDMGVVSYNPQVDGRLTAEELILRADQAMYFAKEHKLNHVVMWNPSMKGVVPVKD